MSSITKAFKYGFMATTAAIGTLVLSTEVLASDGPAGSAGDQVAKFRQLGTELPTPNIFRNAAGAPGPAYWQQQANVNIDAALDGIIASMDIDYVNNSPDTLNYIWLALDQNRFKDGSLARESTIASAAGSRRGDGRAGSDRVSFSTMRYQQAMEDRDYGFEFKSSKSIGNTISLTKKPLAGAEGMNVSPMKTKMATASLDWLSGFRVWPPIPIIRAGRTSNFLDAENSPSNLATITST